MENREELPGIVDYWLHKADWRPDEPTAGAMSVEALECAPAAAGAMTPRSRGDERTAISATTVQMVQSRPDLDGAVAVLSEQAKRAAVYAAQLTIDTMEDQLRVVRDLGAIAGLKKKLEAKRLEYTAPLTELSRKFNDQFKDITIPLTEADILLRGKDKAFQFDLDALRDAAEDAERLRLVLEAEEARETGQIIDQKPGEVLAQARPTGTARVETGTRHFREVPKWALLDEKLVPRAFFRLDEAKINAAVRSGTTEIPGLQIWSEREPVVRARNAPTDRKGE